MQKQHVKMNKHLSRRALPSRPQSEMKLRSLPSTPVISNTRPLSSLSSVLSPPAGQLGPLYEILTMENVNNKPTVDQPRLPVSSRPPPASNGMFPLASGQDIYNVVDKSAKRNKPPVDQPIRSSTQSQDIYIVVDKTARFRRGQSSDQLPVSPTGEPQGIVHIPGVVKKKPVRSPQQQRQQQETSELYSVVQKKTKPVERAKCKDVHRDIIKPVVANTRQLASGHQQLHLLQTDRNIHTGTAGEVSANRSPVKIKSKTLPEDDIFAPIEDIIKNPFAVNERNQVMTDNGYGVVNQPMTDNLPLANLPARRIDEDEYGVVNQPMSDSLPFPSLLARKTDEGVYGAVNQPMSDNLPLPSLPARKTDEDEYGVINQPMSDNLPLASPPAGKINKAIIQPKSDNLFLANQLAINIDDNVEYGVVNQPMSDDVLSVEPPTTMVSKDKFYGAVNESYTIFRCRQMDVKIKKLIHSK